MTAQYYQSILPVIDLDKNITPKDIIPVSPTNIAYYTIPAVGSNTGNASSSFVFNVIPPSRRRRGRVSLHSSRKFCMKFMYRLIAHYLYPFVMFAVASVRSFAQKIRFFRSCLS